MRPDVLYSLSGGILIGLSASLLMIVSGKVCGISGIFSNIMMQVRESWRWIFFAGFFCGALIMRLFFSNLVADDGFPMTFKLSIVAGLLVGVGTKMGGGCTSGHGICGIARFSKRSIVATILFMVTAMLVVFLKGVFN